MDGRRSSRSPRNAADALTEPGATRADVETAVESGLDATETLGEELRASVPPDTPEGDRGRRPRSMRSWTRCARRTTRSGLRSAGIPEGAGLARDRRRALGTGDEPSADGRQRAHARQRHPAAWLGAERRVRERRLVRGAPRVLSTLHAPGWRNWQYAPDLKSGVPAGGREGSTPSPGTRARRGRAPSG